MPEKVVDGLAATYLSLSSNSDSFIKLIVDNKEIAFVMLILALIGLIDQLTNGGVRKLFLRLFGIRSSDRVSAPILDIKKLEKAGDNRFIFGARAIPFVGRDDETKNFRKFLPQFRERKFRWMLVYGPGGVGKSRFALEMCIWLKNTGNWHAGFLSEQAEEPDWHHWQPEKPTLIVIDYAARTEKKVKSILAILAYRSLPESPDKLRQPVRVLLLERDKGYWIDSVLGAGTTARPVEQTRYQPDMRLRGINDPWSLIECVIKDGGASLPEKEKTIEYLVKIDPQQRPLFAHFLADAILAGRDPREFDAERLVKDVINRERQNYWTTKKGDAEERALVLATMSGGLNISDLEKMDTSLLPEWDLDLHPKIFRTMTGYLAVDTISPLEPDIVGEYFVDQIMGSEFLSHDNKKELCELAWELNPADMRDFIHRCGQDITDSSFLSFLMYPPRPSTDDSAIQYWFGATARLISTLDKLDNSKAPTVIDNLCEHAEKAFWGDLAFLLGREVEKSEAEKKLVEALFEKLNSNPDGLSKRVPENLIKLKSMYEIIRAATKHSKKKLVDSLYLALKENAAHLPEHGLKLHLGHLADFIELARKHKEDDLVKKIWRTFEDKPETFAVHVRNTPLHLLTYFLTMVRKHEQHNLTNQRLRNFLWGELTTKPDDLIDFVLNNEKGKALGELSAFMNCAFDQGQAVLVKKLWKLLSDRHGNLAAHAIKTPLHLLTNFLDIMRTHEVNRMIEPRLRKSLWKELEKNQELLISRTLENQRGYTLGELSAFVSLAHKHEQTLFVNKLWSELAARQDVLTKRVIETPSDQLRTFIDTAQKHGQGKLLERLFENLANEDNLEHLLKRHLKRPLGHLSALMNIENRGWEKSLVSLFSERQEELWRALNDKRESLVDCATKTPFDQVSVFLDTVRNRGKNDLLTAIWAKFSQEDILKYMIERALDTPFDQLSVFLDTVEDHGQDDLAKEIWERLQEKNNMKILLERAGRTNYSQLGAFITTARNHKQNELVSVLRRIKAVN